MVTGRVRAGLHTQGRHADLYLMAPDGSANAGCVACPDRERLLRRVAAGALRGRLGVVPQHVVQEVREPPCSSGSNPRARGLS